jgi:hypothetical protein
MGVRRPAPPLELLITTEETQPARIIDQQIYSQQFLRKILRPKSGDALMGYADASA